MTLAPRHCEVNSPTFTRRGSPLVSAVTKLRVRRGAPARDSSVVAAWVVVVRVVVVAVVVVVEIVVVVVVAAGLSSLPSRRARSVVVGHLSASGMSMGAAVVPP